MVSQDTQRLSQKGFETCKVKSSEGVVHMLSFFRRKSPKPCISEAVRNTVIEPLPPLVKDGVNLGRYEALSTLELAIENRRGMLSSSADPLEEVMKMLRSLKVQVQPETEASLQRVS